MDRDPIPREVPPILSFEEFKMRSEKLGVPTYNNFPRHFGEDPYLRGTPYYEKFEQQFPEFAASLCTEIQRIDYWNPASFEPFERALYKAYRIMREFGASDEELFAG